MIKNRRLWVVLVCGFVAAWALNGLAARLMEFGDLKPGALAVLGVAFDLTWLAMVGGALVLVGWLVYSWVKEGKKKPMLPEVSLSSLPGPVRQANSRVNDRLAELNRILQEIRSGQRVSQEHVDRAKLAGSELGQYVVGLVRYQRSLSEQEAICQTIMDSLLGIGLEKGNLAALAQEAGKLLNGSLKMMVLQVREFADDPAFVGRVTDMVAAQAGTYATVGDAVHQVAMNWMARLAVAHNKMVTLDAALVAMGAMSPLMEAETQLGVAVGKLQELSPELRSAMLVNAPQTRLLEQG